MSPHARPGGLAQALDDNKNYTNNKKHEQIITKTKSHCWCLQPRDPEDWHKIWTTGGGERDQNRLYEFAEDKYRKVGFLLLSFLLLLLLLLLLSYFFSFSECVIESSQVESSFHGKLERDLQRVFHLLQQGQGGDREAGPRHQGREVSGDPERKTEAPAPKQPGVQACSR